MEKNVDGLKNMNDTTSAFNDDSNRDGGESTKVIECVNMVDVSSDTEEEEPSSPTTCSLASEVIEQHMDIQENTAQHVVRKDPSLDDVLGRTIH